MLWNFLKVSGTSVEELHLYGIFIRNAANFAYFQFKALKRSDGNDDKKCFV
jgi:hypothetical protein